MDCAINVMASSSRPFLEANSSAHKGLFGEGFNRPDLNLPAGVTYRSRGNFYTNLDLAVSYTSEVLSGLSRRA